MQKFTFSLIFGISSLFGSSLVVYNSNIGLVHEERPFKLQKNENTIIYKDVASSIITDSINLKLPKEVQLYSQQYRYDKLNLSKLLEYNIGKKVKIAGKEYTLLSANSKQVIVKNVANKIVTKKSEDVVFNKIPSQLLSKPSLIWNVKTSKNINAKLKLDYLIQNIKWKANYVLDVEKQRANLRGFITVTNNSGKSFQNTTLYTLAGKINRIAQHHPRVMYAKILTQDSMAVKESTHEGYHIYKVPFKVSLTNKEKTQINFLNKQNLQIKRSYEALMNNPLYFHGEQKMDVSQFILLQNIGVPLPAGTIRVYSKLHDTSILLGENTVAHTPKKKALKIKIGTNFNIKVKQSILKRNDTKNYYSANIRYTLSNSSNEVKTIKVVIPFNRDVHSNIKSKQKYRFTKGNLATFSIKVKANAVRSFDVHFESRR